MKTATIHEVKKELNDLSPSKALELCLRLAKYKKDNKELLTYLLFESHNERTYIESLKKDIDHQFSELNLDNLYYAKKGMRKILRITNKFIRYSGIKETEVEVLIYFCTKIKNSGVRIEDSVALTNLYQGQLKKIKKVLSSLHEDLQYDFNKELEQL